MKLNFLYNKKTGVTLIELIIVIAIFGLVLSIVFPMNLFGIKTFNKSNNRSQNQSDVRMAADFITKKIRYAKSVQIIDNPTPTEGENELYLENSTGKIIYYENETQINIPGVSGITDYKLSFKKKSDYIIEFTVGKTDTTEYDINSEVTILNSSNSSSITVNSSDDKGIILVNP